MATRGPGPLKSDNVCQRYGDWDWIDNRSMMALTGTAKGVDFGSPLEIKGDYIANNGPRHHHSQRHPADAFNPASTSMQNGRRSNRMPDLPFEELKQRDDLENKRKFRPGF